MTGRRRALLIGASIFADSDLSPLPSSDIGVHALADVLSDPLIGEFEVEVRRNSTLREIGEAIEQLIASSESDDLLLLYYIGHGLRHDTGELRLAVADTGLHSQMSNSLGASWLVSKAISGRAAQVVIVLDCCYSGVDLTDWMSGLHGSTRSSDLWVLASSGTSEASYDRRIDVTDGYGQMGSVFTGTLIEGLRTGAADLNGDGTICIDELAAYVTKEVRRVADQTPVLALSGRSRAIVAHAPASFGAAPATDWSIETRGYGDRPATVDLLSRGAMLKAFWELLAPARNIRHEDHAGPTVIALDGAWGVGKTSMIDLSMHMLRHWPEPEVAAKEVGRLSVFAARRALGGHGKPLWTNDMVAHGRRPSLITARFEPWAHQTGEQVWAGLTKTLLCVVNTKFLGDDKAVTERYWFQRNIERVDRARLRRSLQKEALSPLFAVAFLALLAPIIAQMARSTDVYRILGLTDIMGANIALTIVAVALLAGVGHTTRRYRRPAADYLPAELFVGPIASNAFADGYGDEALRDPYRNARSGYLYLLQHDVFAALKDVEDAGHHIVLFVDDLDRCTPRTTAEVFEAITLFVNRTFPVTRFVLCLDTAAVAAHLDEVHSVLQGKPLDTDDPSPGWSFMRKLIQLTIPIPAISPDAVAGLVDELLPKPATPNLGATTHTTATEPGQKEFVPTKPVSSETRLPSEAETTAVVKLLEHNDQVRSRIVERLRDQPVRSVREAKRILTAWQYYVRVSFRLRPTGAVPVEEAMLLVVLAEINSRWPAAQRLLCRAFDGWCGLALLAAAADDDLEWARALRKISLHTAPHEKCAIGMRELLRRYDGVRLAQLAAELH